MNRQITWQNCIQACDDLIETIKLKMQEEPDHDWQKDIDDVLARREEFIILAKEQRILEEEQFKQSLQIVCDNVLKNVRRQQS